MRSESTSKTEEIMCADYGYKLSDVEYEQAIVELHTSQPALPSKEQDKLIRKRELFLAIDHRLGKDFPRVKREALWLIHERLEQKRLRLALRYGFYKLIGKGIEPASQKLNDILVEEYIQILGEKDTRILLELSNGLSS